MEGYEVKFKLYAESQEQADALSRAVRDFVRRQGDRGIAVTADKMAEAIRRWGDNPFVLNFLKR